MTNPEFSQPIPEQPNYGREVLNYFLEQQTHNPEYMTSLAERLWSDLSPEEKDAMAVTQATFFPDDLSNRQKSLKAQLIVDYIRDETTAVSKLEATFQIGSIEPFTD